jgi:hypothetical protein
MSIKEGSKSASTKSPDAEHPEDSTPVKEDKNTGEQMRCPVCKKHLQLIRVSRGAALIDVHPRTIYRYIDEGLVYGLKVVGKTYRVCKQCLMQQHLD